tara:strand:+ start:634 stop:738 length:105 start_codon:yes stop_codon:yes gene_type:complete
MDKQEISLDHFFANEEGKNPVEQVEEIIRTLEIK